MNTYEEKYPYKSDPVYSPAEFRREALTVIRTALYQRKAILNKSRFDARPAIAETQRFMSLQVKTISKISKYILTHYDQLTALIPPTNQPLINRLKRIRETAEIFKDYEPVNLYQQ